MKTGVSSAGKTRSADRPHMDATRRQSWVRAVVVVGAMYAVVGILFGLPASHAHAWRLAAWVVSGVAYAIHMSYECLRLRNSTLAAATHVALAAALGAFGLALGAIVRTTLGTSSSSQHLRLLLVALVIWPLITGVPAFLVGFVASGLLARRTRTLRLGRCA